MSLPNNSDLDGLMQEESDYLLELSDLGIIKYKLDGTIKHINKNAIEILELKNKFSDSAKILGKNIRDLSTHLDTELMLNSKIRKKKSIRNVEYNFETLDGYKKWIQKDLFYKVNEKTKDKYIYAVIRDITKQKKTEKSLQSEREILFKVLKNMPYGVALINDRRELSYINTRFKEITGYRLDEISTVEKWLSRAFPDKKYKEWVIKIWEEEIVKGDVTRVLKVICGDGTVKDVEFNSNYLDDGTLVLSISDVTKRKKVENAVKESEKMYRGAIEVTGDVPYYLDYDKMEYEFVGEGIQRLTGYTKDEFIPQLWKSMLKKTELTGKLKGMSVEEAAKKARGPEGLSWTAEYLVKNKNGDEKWISNTAIQVRNDKGKVVASLGILRDINEQRRNEKIHAALYNISRAVNSSMSLDELFQEIHKNLGTIIDTTNFFIALYDKENDIISFPYFVDEKDSEFEILSAKDSGSLTGTLINSGKPLLIKKDKFKDNVKKGEMTLHGTMCEVWIGVPLKIKDEIIGAVGVQSYDNHNLYSKKDIEILESFSEQIAIAIERKKSEEALVTSEKKYRSLFKNMLNGIVYARVIFDKNNNATDFIFMDVNDTFEEITQFKREDIIGKRAKEILKEDDAIEQKYLNMVGETALSGKERKFDIYFNPMKKWLDVSLFSTEKGYFVAAFNDITESKNAEDALKKSEEKYRTIFESFQDVYFQIDLEGRIKIISPSVKEVTGYKPEEVIGKYARDLIKNPSVRYTVFEILNKNGKVRDFEIDVLNKKGEIINVSLSSQFIYGENGQPVAIENVMRDITGRKKAEQQLKESEEKFRTISEQSLMGIIIFQDDKVKYANRNAANIFDITPQEMMSFDISAIKRFVHPDYEEFIYDQIRKKFAGETDTLSEYIYKIVTKQKEEKWIKQYSKIINYQGAPGDLVTIIDITEQKQMEEISKKLEEQLFQAQKMESIGRLAGGIAHDFNNILTSVMGYAEMLKMKYIDPSTIEGKAVDIIYKGTERAANLTRQLLGFARGGKYNPETIDVNEIIKDAVKVSEKIFEKNIEVEYDFSYSVKTVEVDRTQIIQVLTNLIINAKDAMPMGGNIIFKTENFRANKKFAEHNQEFKNTDYVKITVKDTGIGMTSEIREHIFEPFFTTKGKGKGTGLGLATVYGIIKNHNGHISCNSKPGEGTSFEIYLPASEKKITKDDDLKEKILTGKATILVVDDEENVRDLIEDQLKLLGYKVILASEGQEAIKIYKERHREIDLILLDMIMPQLSGKETFFKLKKINPELKVLLVSGFSQDVKATEVLRQGAIGFIQKPFKIQDLSEIINKKL